VEVQGGGGGPENSSQQSAFRRRDLLVSPLLLLLLLLLPLPRRRRRRRVCLSRARAPQWCDSCVVATFRTLRPRRGSEHATVRIANKVVV